MDAYLHHDTPCFTLNLMVNSGTHDLDVVFAALSHAVRRDTLDRLSRGPSVVSDLAAPHRMSLAGFIKHVRALEAAGLIACVKEGRMVTCSLVPRPFRKATDWMESRERLWNARFDALSRLLSNGDEAVSKRRSRT